MSGFLLIWQRGLGAAQCGGGGAVRRTESRIANVVRRTLLGRNVAKSHAARALFRESAHSREYKRGDDFGPLFSALRHQFFALDKFHY